MKQIGFQKRKNERGASLVDYALLLAAVAAVAIASITVLGQTMSGKINHSADLVAGATGIPGENPGEDPGLPL